jgi:L-asparaginase II
MRAGAGDWVAKVGAAGVQVIGVRSRGLGVAIKIADGHSEARFVAAFAVLRALGLVEPDDAELSRYAKIGQLNASGLATGELRPVFTLAAH